MGGKRSDSFQSDRPESGGADRDDEREHSGLLERDKQAFAEEQQKKRQQYPPGEARHAPREDEEPPSSRR